MKCIYFVLLYMTMWTCLIAARALGTGVIDTQDTPVPQETMPASAKIGRPTPTLHVLTGSISGQMAPIQVSPTLEPKIMQSDKASETRWTISGHIEIVIGMALVGLLFIGLHFLNIVQNRRNRTQLASFKARVEGLSSQLQQLNLFMNDSQRATKSVDAKVEKHQLMAEHQINSQEKLREDIALLASQVEQVRQQANEGMKFVADATNAIAIACEWQARRLVQGAIAARSVNNGDQDTLFDLQQQAEMMEAVTQRVRPLVNEFTSVCIWVQQRGSFSKAIQECAERLLGGLRGFEQIEAGIRQKIKLLQEESPTERLAAFREQEKKLVGLLHARHLPVNEYVREYQSQMDHLFPAFQESYMEMTSPLKREGEGKRIAASAPDLLMDWMDDFFQFYEQIPDDPDLSQHFANILKLARDVLDKFNLQMEEVRVGLTLFDRRIHDAAMVTASSQYPVNTIIGLQRCGFRRKSTGEVLRRPQVIVAGSGGTTI